ncbi:hypothetical protein BHE97_01420 [Aeromicrobium sp. PE09-221]|uniref:enoyl-CoA hydratase/isomerase family protein n=1 Tax=Aeromicrobium sp. PE09-221 TaxID=1898043 RepID=UPI000B3E94F8|nr:enoyl-CoA hydratase-related protein [Aeromicrobium sp. PE09-221]OUZ12406.1 hypothetical protein BHE97_01420 [Aeromicrobium sp. PE09-221]
MTTHGPISSQFEHLMVEEVDDAIVLITLDRPPVNAVNHTMYRELATAFGEIATPQTGARAVVVTGRGRHFCAGNDLAELAEFNARNAEERLSRLRRVLWSVYDCDLPVIAAVHGGVVGAGVGIAASSDAIIATADARFSIPELAAGLIGGASHMRRLAPDLAVRRMVLTGEPIDASTLRHWGSVERVVPRDLLIPTAVDLARTMTKHPPDMLKAAKRAMRVTEYADLKTGYHSEHLHALEVIEDRQGPQA